MGRKKLPTISQRTCISKKLYVNMPMVYLILLHVSLFTKKTESYPAGGRLDCKMSIKMASQPCGGAIGCASLTELFKIKLE